MQRRFSSKLDFLARLSLLDAILTRSPLTPPRCLCGPNGSRLAPTTLTAQQQLRLFPQSRRLRSAPEDSLSSAQQNVLKIDKSEQNARGKWQWQKLACARPDSGPRPISARGRPLGPVRTWVEPIGSAPALCQRQALDTPQHMSSATLNYPEGHKSVDDFRRNLYIATLRLGLV